MGRKIRGISGISESENLARKINDQAYYTYYRQNSKNNNFNSRHFNTSNTNNLKAVIGANNYLQYGLRGIGRWPKNFVQKNNNNKKK